MAIEKVKELLEAIRNDPRAKEMLKNLPPIKNDGERIVSLLSAARELGYDLTEADLKDYAEAAAAARKKKTDAQAEAIQTLDDSEVEKAVGGSVHDNCDYTFEDFENCWKTDGCDKSLINYTDYQCWGNHNGVACHLEFQLVCQQVFFR